MTYSPYIFILDLDGTIIGNCKYQTWYTYILNLAKFKKIKLNKDEQFKKSYNYSSKLMRPYFGLFMKTIRKHYPESLIYIYTASTKDWATIEIKTMEKENKIKFNRPIFARQDCIIDDKGNFMKSIDSILEKIKKCNKNITIDRNKVIFVDDSDVYLDNKDKQIFCPRYNYKQFIDYSLLLKNDMFENEYVNKELNGMIKQGLLNPYWNNSSISITDERKYKWLYKNLKKINIENKEYLNDNFWETLAKALIYVKNNNKPFKEIRSLINQLTNNTLK